MLSTHTDLPYKIKIVDFSTLPRFKYDCTLKEIEYNTRVTTIWRSVTYVQTMLARLDSDRNRIDIVNITTYYYVTSVYLRVCVTINYAYASSVACVALIACVVRALTLCVRVLNAYSRTHIYVRIHIRYLYVYVLRPVIIYGKSTN